MYSKSIVEEAEKFKQLVNNSSRILITSHISPDPDALASVLLLGTTLKHNYPDKKVVIGLEEEPEGLDFLTRYSDIKFGRLLGTAKQTNPDLFIMLDAVNYERCSRADGDKIRQYLADNKIKTAIIDHHESTGKDDADVYIYQGSIATTQDVYEVCFDHLKLKKPEGYGQTTMLGIYSDSGGFIYANPRHRATFKIVDELLDLGVNLEAIKARLNNYNQEHLLAIGEFAKNITTADGYTYSFLSDQFITTWQLVGQSLVSLNTAAGIFVNEYIRNIGNRKWGFIVYRDLSAGENMYSVSLRSQSDVKDVSQIANKLGGGGHKPAAGARVQADSVEQAILKVQQTITSA